MKKIVSVILFALFLFTGFVASSQNPERFPMVRQRIIQAKLHEIKVQLKLDQTIFDQFRPIYLKYEREISSIDFRNLARMMRVNADSISSEEADQMIVNQLETARKLISIREKYYKEFKTILTPQQIIILYQTEAELRKKVMQELKRRMMSR